MGALGATDVRADDLSDAFDFKQTPQPVVTIGAPPFSPAPDPPELRGGEDADPDDGVVPHGGACMTDHSGR